MQNNKKKKKILFYDIYAQKMKKGKIYACGVEIYTHKSSIFNIFIFFVECDTYTRKTKESTRTKKIIIIIAIYSFKDNTNTNPHFCYIILIKNDTKERHIITNIRFW